MKKIVFIIVRYSVLMNSKAWNISRDTSFDEYRKSLFAKERLEQHFFFFQNVMLPSVACQVKEQGDVETRLLVVTSSELPEKAHKNLLEATSEYEWADILYLEPEGNFHKTVNGHIKDVIAEQDSVYATVRLDDDDALHSSFLTNLEKYLVPKFSGHVISYPLGSAVLFDQELGKITSAIEVDYPKIALGLSLINAYDKEKKAFQDKTMNIFQTGKHTNVQERHPLVLDESLSAYVRMCYKSSDTAEMFFKKRKKISKEIPADQAFSGFQVNIPIAKKA